MLWSTSTLAAVDNSASSTRLCFHLNIGESCSEERGHCSPYYFQDLPAAVATGKTDADGKFTLTLPPGKYVFAATASRSVSKDTEQYAWLVKVDASNPVHGLLLSNDNQAETGCKECMLLLPDVMVPSATAGIAKTGITKE